MLAKIERLVKVGWALAVLSFGMGVWATTLQYRVSSVETSVSKIQSQREVEQKEDEERRKQQAAHDAAMDTKIDFIVGALRPPPQSK